MSLRAIAAGDVTAKLADLEHRVSALERRLEAHDRARGADAADAHLLAVLAESTHGHPFRARDLLAHAEVEEPLATALRDAGLQSAGEIGAWLRDRRGAHDDGVIIIRLGSRWCVRHRAHDIDAADPA